MIDAEPDRLPQRRVPAARRGAGLGARPRLHLRRRRVRARARLRAASRSACRSISRGCSAASTASALPNPHTRRAVGSARSASSSRASRSTTRACTSRSRAAWPSATTRSRKGVPPTVFMMSNPLPTADRASRSSDGVAVVTAEDNRWHRCDLKTISLLGNVLMRQLADRRGRGGDRDVPRRLSDRGFGVERADRQGRHDRRAAEGQP